MSNAEIPEDDGDVEEFTERALALLAEIDDPERVYDDLKRGNVGRAFARIDEDREDTETTLTDLYCLAVAITERNPEDIEALRDETDSVQLLGSAESPSSTSASARVDRGS